MKRPLSKPWTRPAAVAGAFYPAEAGALVQEVSACLGVDAPASAPDVCEPVKALKALVVPHAGYQYSGRTAGVAYRLLSRDASALHSVQTVVLLGPNHRVPLRGMAASSADAFATPLGNVPLVPESSPLGQLVAGLDGYHVHDEAHAQEHALEVQLPFLQQVLGEFTCLPLLVGQLSARQQAEFAQCLAAMSAIPGTLIVVSTDLSHFLPAEIAERHDALTRAKIAARQADLGPQDACGASPLNGFLVAAQTLNLKPTLLHSCHSGDAGRDRRRVVGYASWAFHAPTSS